MGSTDASGPLPSIRPARADDVDALVRLRLALLHEFAPELARAQGESLAAATRAYLEANLPKGTFYAAVAEAAGEVIGCSGVAAFQRPPYPRNLSGREAYVLNMYTVPQWRRRGVGAALLADALQYARRSGACRAWLHTSEDGRGLYERAGFRAKDNEMELML